VDPRGSGYGQMGRSCGRSSEGTSEVTGGELLVSSVPINFAERLHSMAL
jgi:hypothetical protein